MLIILVLPKIDEAVALEAKPAKQRAIELLDILEGRVEKLRRDASRLEEDKDALLASLDAVRNADIMGEIIECKYKSIYGYVHASVLKLASQKNNILANTLLHCISKYIIFKLINKL